MRALLGLTLTVAIGSAVFGCQAMREDRAWIIDTQQGCKIPTVFSTYYPVLSWDGKCDVDTNEAIGFGTLRWVEPDGTIGFYRTCLRPEHRLSRCGTGTGI